jgi:hypothetical protein
MNATITSLGGRVSVCAKNAEALRKISFAFQARNRFPSADTAKSSHVRPGNVKSGAGRPTSSVGVVRTGSAMRRWSAET